MGRENGPQHWEKVLGKIFIGRYLKVLSSVPRHRSLAQSRSFTVSE